MPIYEKATWQLMREMVKEFDLEKGEIIPRDRITKWFKEKYPKIKKATVDAHLLKMSINAPSRIHYSAKPNQDDLFFQIDKGNFRLFDHENDPIPIYEKIIAEHVDEDEIEEEDESLAEFAYESDLKNFLSKNLDVVEQGLRLYDDEGITGIEFPVGGRFIDILTVDEKNDFVVIELKVSRGYDRTIGQILRYVGWISQNLADPDQKVRGLIIAREISNDLILACNSLPNINLFEYELSFSLNPVEKIESGS